MVVGARVSTFEKERKSTTYRRNQNTLSGGPANELEILDLESLMLLGTF